MPCTLLVSSGFAQLTFTDNTVAAGLNYTGNCGGVSFGDYNNDGFVDIYIVNEHGGTGVLFENNGDGTFTNVTATAGVAAVSSGEGGIWNDHDRNGLLDLYVSNEADVNYFYHNNGDGTFTDNTAASGTGSTLDGYGIAVGDYDNDGDLDIYVSNFGQSNVLYINDGNANHYLNVELKGLANNTLGFGAVITLVSGANTLVKVVEGGGGFSSQNSIPVEFGLGSATSVDSIIVNWPYGRDQVIMTSEIDTTIIITEDIYEHDMNASGYVDTKKMILLK